MNSKNKGGVFERDCSRMLSLWWTGGKRDDAIWRSASSGALTTVGRGRYLAHTGDFAATDAEAAPLFDKVIIEAKRGYNRYSVQDLLDVPTKSLRKNPVWEMFDKLQDACFHQRKIGVLLWKRDRRKLLVFCIDPAHDLGFHRKERLGFLCPGAIWTSGMIWEMFESTVSADRIKSLPDSPVASSSLTLSTSA